MSAASLAVPVESPDENIQSGYLPRIFGIAMAITGVAFATHTLLLVLAPAYASPLLMATAAVAFIPLILWLLIRGVNMSAWRRS